MYSGENVNDAVIQFTKEAAEVAAYMPVEDQNLFLLDVAATFLASVVWATCPVEKRHLILLALSSRVRELVKDLDEAEEEEENGAPAES